ncbi:hypothetical protein ACQJBY_005816 [Aegilops geniculata]
MPLVAILFILLIYALHAPCSTARSTILAGDRLTGDDKLVSRNGKFVLGFFQPRSEYSSQQTPAHWYIGLWFGKIPKLTPVWVANRDRPIVNLEMSELTISDDGNLAILNKDTKSTIWSTHANITAKKTTVVLMDNGNLILGDASNSSNVIRQSFDYPTDGLLPGAKQGVDKVTGLTRHLVSKKSLIDPAPGRYCVELDTTGPGQFLYKLCNSSIVYWSSGEWNGHYFSSLPEMNGANLFTFEFVNNRKEEYFIKYLTDDKLITVSLLDISGQEKQLVWVEGSQDWMTVFTQPRDQCDVYATCGSFTICNSNTTQVCDCLKGFSIRSPKDWEIEDRSGGCIRNVPLDCGARNQSRNATTDKFYPMTKVRLPAMPIVIEAAGSIDHCAQACLDNCSCIAYSYINRCSLWYDDLLNIKQGNIGTTSDEEVLYLRISAKDAESWRNTKRRKEAIWAITAASAVALVLLAVVMWFLLIWRSKRKHTTGMYNNAQGGNGIVAFRYIDLQHATKNFSEKLGGGSFGSVFKGLLTDSTAIAVKRLDGVRQGEKEFRAEVSSIGIIQHINLVKLIGFCCKGSMRLLVYEYMPNLSLDAHLFRSNTKLLSWSVRYQIALGIARGLAYLHDSCRDCIIHCDIKPQNILLDTSFVPKVVDFGMAKFLGRDFSRVLTTFRGTIGYLPPEWISGVAITPKVDVYSYGMMLLEIVSGRSNNTCKENSSTGDHSAYFPVQVARKLLAGDIVGLLDDKLHGDVNLDEVERVCKVACWCIQDGESNRPTMGEVVQILEGLLELEVPPIPRLLQAIA